MMTDTCSICGSDKNVKRIADLLPPKYDPTPVGERRLKSYFDPDWPDDVVYRNVCRECLLLIEEREEP